MSERRDYVALDWVTGEIQETLTQATQALQAYVSNRDDTTKLRFCLTHIHQVHGTLKMVEFFGAALLAEEMEYLAQSLTQGIIHESHIDDALSVLQKSIIQLPIYLERVKASRLGLPATLLPLLNDLRAIRGESLLSETVLFSPNLTASTKVVVGDTAKLLVEGNELKEVAHKLRQMFQIALLGVMRGQDVRKNINYLAKVCARLVKLTDGRPPQPLWKVCIAVLEGLLNGAIETSVAIKILLRQLDRQIRQILEQGEIALNEAPPEHLLKNLLYYIACCNANSKYIKQIRKQYNLDTSLLGDGEIDGEDLASPNNLAMQAVMHALSKELSDIKAAISSAGTNGKELANVLPLFRRVSDTMAILGMGTTLKPIQESYSQLTKVLATKDLVSPRDINEISHRIRAVEVDINPVEIIEPKPDQSLFNDSEEAQEQLDGALDSVLRECRAGLEQTKDAIIEFVATQWNHSCLADVPGLLAQIHGSLAMVPLEQAASIIKSCENYVNQVLLAERSVPEWQMLDTLADAITSIDYYLERLADDSTGSDNGILEVAAESVAELGFPISIAVGTPDSIAIDTTDIVKNGLDFSVSDENVTDQEIKQAESDISVSDDSLSLAEVIPFQPKVSEDSTTNKPATSESVDDKKIDDEDFDPEIVEIFIEEAGEVLETIEEYLPQWISNENDEDARSTIRRAFHTLKGSGRMVNAVDISELAWAVENMLNRVLDNSFSMDKARFNIVTQAKSHVPDMVVAFENRRRYELSSVGELIELAGALSKEQNPEIIEQHVESVKEAVSEVDETDNVELKSDIDETVVPIHSDSVEQPQVEFSEEDKHQEQISKELLSEGDKLDSELLEIFAIETQTHLQTIDAFIIHCKDIAGPADLTDDLQRALHTLKGSATMAGVEPVATLIAPVEYVIKELNASQLKIDIPLVDMLERASGLIRIGIEQLKTTPLQPLPGVDLFIDQFLLLYKERLAHVTDENAQDRGIDPEAQNQFLSDSLDLITTINDKLALWHSGDFDSNDLDTIDQSIGRLIKQAENINMAPLTEFGQILQSLYRTAANFDGGIIDDDYFALTAKGSEQLIDMLDQIAGHQNPEYDQQLFVQIQDFEFEVATESEFPVEDVSEETFEIAETPEMAAIEEVSEVAEVVEIKALEEVPEIDEVASVELQDEIEDADVSGLIDTNIHESEEETNITDNEIGDENLIDLLSKDDEIASESDVVELDLDTLPAEIFTTDLEEQKTSDDATDNVDDQEVGIVTEIMTDLVSAASPDLIGKTETYSSEGILSDDDIDEEMDAEILEIFLEEADDLLEAIDEAIHKWNDDREGQQYLDDLQRILHTLKGGARLTNRIELGNLSHNFETFLINAEKDSTPVNDAFLSEVQQYQDQLIAQVIAIKNGGIVVPAYNELVIELDESAVTDVQEKETVTDTVLPLRQTDKTGQAEVVPFVASKPESSPMMSPQPTTTPSMTETVAKKGPQEVVKVSAQLLEDLVNLAGETSISRGQAEEQISELVFSLDEMQITVDRLQEQVRRLDMETEQQILYRQEQVESEGLEGFDPLEMDRYSALQQLSRSLLESSSDLIDIKATLSEKSSDMETLLIQQSRINTELQEGLMRSRMVPFSRMVPRLRRIVRQVGGELNKKIDFNLHNIEGELDRTVLDRMVAPLEHMLRNAVDHGLESQEERLSAGKSKKGTISLGLHREGGEIVITLSDDGRGINLDAVKTKAIERGLMEPDAALTDHEISQFILQSGFSTATAVTQLSGRGVGMDVVHSEIKQLGGGIDIQSELGQGTRFIIRLPFTVSVNRALMVSVDGDIYAIPLNTIEGIVRVSPFELEAYYQPDAPMYEYAGQPYLLRYMGALLRRGEKPLLEGQSTPLPVILVRGAEHSVAIQVDHLMGSREIVVKPLGPQFSMVQGLSGATVLGDGSVVVILDLLAMIRADASRLHKDFTLVNESVDRDERALMVMVVDDSVTVRKVTSRFLERQGIDVLLAKDGADAMSQLQDVDRLPDVMLLDIEMPRMDGFEVASRVRHSSRLKELPIIMITSRTGEKHRDRALSLGVNYYMGKPYQEGELLETINSLAGITTE